MEHFPHQRREETMSNTSILFTRLKPYGAVDRFNDIYSIEPDGSAETMLIGNPPAGPNVDYTSARYNSDRSKIALLSTRNHPDALPNVFIMQVASGALTQITLGDNDFLSVDWSPDDSRLLAICADANGEYQVHIMQADGSGLTPLTSGPREPGDAQFSPDGTQIVFSRMTAPPDPSSSRLWLMSADGSAQQQLATGDGYAAAACWSPDGASLVFSYAGGGQPMHIRKLDMAGGTLTDLTQPPAGFVDDNAIWTAAGIVFSRSSNPSQHKAMGGMHIMGSDGSNVQILTPLIADTLDFPSDG